MTSFLPIIREAIAGCDDPGRWSIHHGSDPAKGWLQVVRDDAVVPEQGWKLHVSGCEASAVEVLGRALPVLLSNTATFKLAASSDVLNDLNEGNGGLSQIGKFITVYPQSDEQAVRLAVALDRAVDGSRGPRILSDRALRPGSLVHYRYGGFGNTFLQTPMGQILPALRTPDGQLVPDERTSKYVPPSWAADPFEESGAAAPPPPPARLLGGRYLVVATIHESARGLVLSAIDVLTPRPCLLKFARRDAQMTAGGRDACDRLRHEMRILDDLPEDGRFPRALDLIEENDGLYLAMTEIDGSTLEQHVRELCAEGCLPSASQLLSWARELADILRMFHAKGIVYRDLKSPNVLVGEDGHLRIVDFELAQEATGPVSDGRGTRGYMSPEQEQGRAPAISDDIHGLGAVLYFAATGAEPSLSPRSLRLLDRPIALLNPAMGGPVAEAVSRCLDDDPATRFASIEAFEAALSEIERRGVGDDREPHVFAAAAMDGESHYRQLAEEVADTLCRTARCEADGYGLYWLSTHESRDGIISSDLGTGSAGPVLALAELTEELGREDHREVLRRAARRLAKPPGVMAGILPGLYVGQAGTGVALLRAGEVLQDQHSIDAALDRSRLIAALPYVSQDLFNGTAGRLRFHLLLWTATSDSEQLRHALDAGAELLQSAEGSPHSGCRWTIPPGYGGLSGLAYLGNAHGAAGIADALLDLFEATGDERFLATACGAARWIAGHAIPTLPDESGVDWPDVPEGTVIGPFWCHGAAGIGQFLLRLVRHGVMPEMRDLVVRAARSASLGARWSGPTQCHGLAGNIQFLLDVYQWSDHAEWLDHARQLGRILQAFRLESEGNTVFPSESPSIVTPDYMVGYAGVAVSLLRLSAPARIARPLTRRYIAIGCHTVFDSWKSKMA